jgi:hypothetical protein
MFVVPSFFGFQDAGKIPQVSDADAQAFVNRVYTAGGTLSSSELSAVNTLVIDLKGYSIWTLMKAIYPMVGGGTGTTAARQAACSQNLFSSSFTGTFTSGWTFASTGVTPNGTSAYMDTNLNALNNLSNFNSHFGFYSRTSSVANVTVEMGAANPIIVPPNFAQMRVAVNYLTGGLSITSFTTNNNAQGFWLGSTRANNDREVYLNGTSQSTNTNTFNTNLSNLKIFLSARNDDGVAAVFSDKQCAFASIGDGLTDTQASNFYTAVQAFQTTLSRQV